MSIISQSIKYNLSKTLKKSTLLRRVYAKLFEPDRSRQFELTQWMNQGLTLLKTHKLQSVSFEQGDCWVTLPNGLKLRYLTEIPGAGAEPAIYRGEYEPEITQLLLAHLKDKTTFIDIGANLGWFSLHIAQHYPLIHIHAFEPGEFAYANIRKNIAKNDFQDNITLNHVAVTNHCGTEHFTNQQLGHALNHISKENTTNLREVIATTLDAYANENSLQPVGLIKCDVEGAEMLVIEGALELLKRDEPNLLLEICPLWMTRFNHTPIQLWEQLSEHGYSYHVIRDNGEQICSGDFLQDVGDGANVFFSSSKDA